MNCSEFRKQHCAFVDDTLPGVEIVRMQHHLGECSECTELDTRIRRSLMIARNIPSIQLSDDFGMRLEAKLQRCRDLPESEACANFRAVASIGAIASVLMLGYVATSLYNASHLPELSLPPVVAMAEAPQNDEIHAIVPSLVASVSAGMPIWPVALFAEQVSIHMANPAQISRK